MKTGITTLFFFAFILNNSFAQTYVLDTLYEDSWDAGSSVFFESIRSNYGYDADTNRSEAVRQVNNAGVWGNVIRNQYTYDVNGLLTQNLFQTWNVDSSDFLDATRSNYSYNGNNQVLEIIEQNWNFVTLIWDNSSRTLNVYDANNLLTQSENQYWDGSNWANNLEDLFTYDLLDRIAKRYSLYWGGFQYDSSGQFIYTYNADDSVTQIYGLTYTGLGWDQSTQENFVFNGLGQRDSSNSQYWDGSVNGWFGFYNSYYYDGNENLDYYIRFQDYYNAGNVEVDTISRYRYIWREFVGDTTGINTYDLHPVELNVYPNPAQEYFTVSFDQIQTTALSLEVFDLMGRILIQTNYSLLPAGEMKLTENISKLPPGNYSVQITSGKTRFTTSFIKQ